MSKDRIIQIVCLVLIAVGFVAVTQFMYAVDVERRELQLGADTQIDERVPPEYAILAQLGSFRGVAINALWYRLEELKQDGKFSEANELSEFITKLQPRFPQVWGFMGWNMAYNISVKTSTPEERWDWVNKGIDLIRDQGIPNNPNAIRLYRELGWILFHKVGGTTDDMHHYYKAQLAKEWHPIVGNAIERMSTPQYIESWKLIDQITRDYFVGGQTGALVGTPSTETLIRFRTDFPETAPLVARFKELGYELNSETLVAWGRLQMLRDYYAWPQVENLDDEFLPPSSRRLIPLLKDVEAEGFAIMRAKTIEERDAAIEAQKLNPGRDALLAFLQAQILIERYHMDPRFMYALMNRFGPVDWRSAGGQSLYWYARGVNQAYDLRDRTKYDQINTDRGIIHSLQYLFRSGSLSFDPLGGIERQGIVTGDPKPEFTDAYELAVKEAKERGEQVDWGVGRDSTYEAGHENFLHDAIRNAYFYYPDPQKREAHRLYDRVRDLYWKKGEVIQTYQEDYKLPMEKFVFKTWVEDKGMEQVPRSAIRGLLYQGLRAGVAVNRPDVWNASVRGARAIHTDAQKERTGGTNANALQDRRLLPPFEEMLLATFEEFLRSPEIPLLFRSRVWRNMYQIDRAMLPTVYDRVIPALRMQADQQGHMGGVLFPDPPNLQQYREAQRRAMEAAEQNPRERTIERQ